MHRTIVLLSLLALNLSGCARVGSQRDTIFCVSTIHALVEGIFDGEVTCGELRRHGSIGLGAVDGVDGELIVLDGVCYGVKADGSTSRLSDSVKTPYALVTPFETDLALSVNAEMDYDQMKARLDQLCPNQNLPYAFRIEGAFSYVKARSVPKQTPPYPRLIEVIKKQPEFEFKDIEGVIVGFRLPPYFDSLAVPGWHCHFLTSDLKGGGHLLAFRAKSLQAAADLSPDVLAVLPQSEAFSKTDFTHRNPEEIDRIMGRVKAR